MKYLEKSFNSPANSDSYRRGWQKIFGTQKRAKRGKQKVERPSFPIIVRNAARCRHCGTEIESTYRHDMVWCSCGRIAVDGGHAYLRRAGRKEDIEEMSVTEPWREPRVGDQLRLTTPIRTRAEVTYRAGDMMTLLEPSETNYRGHKAPGCWKIQCEHFLDGSVWENVPQMIRDCQAILVPKEMK